jgi:glycosyltransferase involved in cell wall biosynthesis
MRRKTDTPANLSVIVTCYNKTPQMVCEAIDSVWSQTVAPLEVILVDDGSKEQHAHNKAISIILPKNVGVAKARDIGVKMSRGKLLLFLDADDILSPDFIQQCGKKIVKNEIVYPNLLSFGDVESPHLFEVPKATPKYLMGKSSTICVTSMIYRKMYDDLGGFRELPLFEDWDFWLRAMCKGYTFAKANTFLMYRQTADTRNRQNIRLKQEVHAQITSPYIIKEGVLCLKAPTEKE